MIQHPYPEQPRRIPAQDRVVLRPPEPEVSTTQPWQDDLLDRSELGRDLTEKIRNEKSITVSLHGGWGTGKTFFLKRWQAGHGEPRQKGRLFQRLGERLRRRPDRDSHQHPGRTAQGQQIPPLGTRSRVGSYTLRNPSRLGPGQVPDRHQHTVPPIPPAKQKQPRTSSRNENRP